MAQRQSHAFSLPEERPSLASLTLVRALQDTAAVSQGSASTGLNERCSANARSSSILRFGATGSLSKHQYAGASTGAETTATSPH